MVQEPQLSDVLSEFARTMLTDFPIEAILDRLVTRIVDVLPVTSAGVTLISSQTGPHYIAASDGAALRFEQLQSELGEGPCVVAYDTGDAVAVADLSGDERFPVFRPRAVAAGLRAVFTFPLRRNGEQFGALDLYRDAPGPLDADSMAAAQTLADVASAYVQNAQSRVDLATAYLQARERSLHDPLTGLANRALLGQRLELAVARARRSGMMAGVLFVDLDRFKSINDNHGHPAGDRLLVAVAGRLRALLRPSDSLARLAGDEFVILCEDLDDVSRVEALALRIHTAMAEPFVLGEITVTVTASVGIAFAGRADDIPGRLLEQADSAMYQAKRRGGGHYEVLDLRREGAADRRPTLADDLHRAVTLGELRLEYQPIVQLADKRICGLEALLRWHHPRFGVVPPAVVVPLAEDQDLLDDIGAWVLRRACDDRHRWSRDDVGVSVNVSDRQLLSHDYVATVESVLADTSTPPHLVTVEITTDAFVSDGERARVVLHDLRHLGVRVTLAHFGARSGSLDHLRRIAVDALKLDPVFVADLPHDRAASAIVSSVVHLARSLGVVSAAQGVETVDQHRGAAALGCDQGQGYFYGRPATAGEVGDRLGVETADMAVAPAMPARAHGRGGVDLARARSTKRG